MARTKTTKLKQVGFFRELGEKDGSMLPFLGKGAYPSDVLDYLRRGNLFIASPGPVGDKLFSECGLIGTASILTDGVWAWREDMIHYVEYHGLELPTEFLNHMHENLFVMPSLDLHKLRGLSL